MNVLFLTLFNMTSINNRGIYEDLLREFIKEGHSVWVVTPAERRNGESTHFVDEEHCRILRVKTGNIQKTNIIEKGISTIMLEPQFVAALKKYLSGVKFDLVLYSTPPITLVSAVSFIKKRDGAKTYLLLKDIFPQNAVDMGMMTKTGVKSVIYKYFRRKEKTLYKLSDYIGCMSEANVKYVLKHNPELSDNRVEVCPNSVEPVDMSVSQDEKVKIRTTYDIPADKKVFVYGGNLGKPQGIPFLIKCLESQKDNGEVFFLIVGDGTEYGRLYEYLQNSGVNGKPYV